MTRKILTEEPDHKSNDFIDLYDQKMKRSPIAATRPVLDQEPDLQSFWKETNIYCFIILLFSEQ